MSVTKIVVALLGIAVVLAVVAYMWHEVRARAQCAARQSEREERAFKSREAIRLMQLASDEALCRAPLGLVIFHGIDGQYPLTCALLLNHRGQHWSEWETPSAYYTVEAGRTETTS